MKALYFKNLGVLSKWKFLESVSPLDLCDFPRNLDICTVLGKGDGEECLCDTITFMKTLEKQNQRQTISNSHLIPDQMKKSINLVWTFCSCFCNSNNEKQVKQNDTMLLTIKINAI